MKNSLLIIGSSILFLGLLSCGNSNNSNNEKGHAFDSTNTMYDDGQSIYDSTGRDTLSPESAIPPTPMN